MSYSAQALSQVICITLLVNIQEFNLFKDYRPKKLRDAPLLTRGLSDRRCQTCPVVKEQILLLGLNVSFINYRESMRSVLLTITWPFLALIHFEEPLFFSHNRASASSAIRFQPILTPRRCQLALPDSF